MQSRGHQGEIIAKDGSKFERFVFSKELPYVTIAKGGTIRFNKVCVLKYVMNTYSHVVLYFDKNGLRIGVEFIESGKDVSGARKISVGTYGAITIRAGGFIKHYGIDISENRRYSVEADLRETNMFIISLKED